MKAAPQIAKFMGPTRGPPGSCRPQMGPMLAPGSTRGVSCCGKMLKLIVSLHVHAGAIIWMNHKLNFMKKRYDLGWPHTCLKTGPANFPDIDIESIPYHVTNVISSYLSKECQGCSRHYFTGYTHTKKIFNTRWRHQMETFSALLVLCAGNSPVTGDFPSERSVTRNFGVFFDLRLNKVNNRDAGDLKRHHAHYDVAVMETAFVNGCKHGKQH